MSKCCTLCGNSELQFSTSFFDSENKEIDIALCSKCQAFVPLYQNIPASNAIEQQAQFHEEWWKDSTKEELEKTLNEVYGLVENLHRYLGPASRDNLILEIGAGRGSLLRALLDADYPAYGCEPAQKLVELARNNYQLSTESLYEMPANIFLKKVVPTLPGRPHAFLLWHVLEHLENPIPLMEELYSLLSDKGCLILQLPLFSQEYIYPEHYFFASHETLHFIANEIGFQVEEIEHDLDNLFVTVCLRKNSLPLPRISFSSYENENTPSPLAQAVLLRDQFNKRLRTLLAERSNTIQYMDRIICERDETIVAQTRLIDERINGMNVMDAMIRERDETIVAQAKIVDDQIAGMSMMESIINERDITIAVQKNHIDERIAGMSIMETMIRERDESIAAQAKIVDDRTAGMSMMELMINERDTTIAVQKNHIDERIAGMSIMEAMIRERDERITAQAKIVSDKIAGMNLLESIINERDTVIVTQAKLISDQINIKNLMEKNIEFKDIELMRIHENKFVKLLIMVNLLRQ